MIAPASAGGAVGRAPDGGLEEGQKRGGVLSARVAQPVDDPHYVVVDLDFADVERATASVREDVDPESPRAGVAGAG